MNHDSPTPADIVLAVPTGFGRFEAQVRLKGWEVAKDADRWDRAFSRLRGLADLYSKDAAGPWTRLLVSGLVAAARANARGEAGRFVRSAAPHAERLAPHQLREVFAACARQGNDALAEEIGAALAREWPECAVGWFARADAAERRAMSRNWRPQAEWAADFRRAMERCQNVGEAERQHITIRFVTAHLRSNGGRREIRDALKSLTIHELSDVDALWLAFGLAHSGHWLDQVKACDIIDTQLDSCVAMSLPAGSNLFEAVSALFEHLPPSPSEVVMERFENIVSHRALEGRAEEWRLALDRRIEAPPEGTLLAEARTLSGPAEALQKATEHSNGEFPETFVGDLCRAIADPNDTSVEKVRRCLVVTPVPKWRALAVAWPAWLAGEVSSEQLDRIGKAWCSRAPRPSYGWWQLAHHFDQAKAREAAEAAAWRGLQDGEDDPLRDVVLGKVLTRVVRAADVNTLEKWLVACERVAKPG